MQLHIFIHNVVRFASASREAEFQTALPCRKDRGKYKCSGHISVTKQDIPSPVIHWICNKCNDGGVISEWKDSFNDLSEFIPTNKSIEVHVLALTFAEYKVLITSSIFDSVFEVIICRAIAKENGVDMLLSETDNDYFMEVLTSLYQCEEIARRAKLLKSVYEKCMILNDEFLFN